MTTTPAIEIDPLDLPVWGAEGMAPIIRKSVQETRHLLWRGRLDADKNGHLWVSTARRLLRQFAGKSPTAA
jgi:hypothetical protein